MNTEQIKRLAIVAAIGVSVVCGVIAAHSAYTVYDAERQIDSLNESSRQINEICPEAKNNPTVRGPFVACMSNRFPAEIAAAGRRYDAAKSRLMDTGVAWVALLFGIGFMYGAYNYVRRGGK